MSIIENAAKRLGQVKPIPSGRSGEVSGAIGSRGWTGPAVAANPVRADDAAAAPQSKTASPKRMAMIEPDRLQQLGATVAGGEHGILAEEFRSIKRPLLRNVAAASDLPVRGALPRNLVMVTSSLPKEGKTFCAVNLALSIAMEKDYTVLLVDADVAHPSVLDRLGLSADVGLMDVLQDHRLDVSEVILHTNIPSFSIIPAGKGNRHATELLASQGMAHLAAELAKRYRNRIVIFDAPPLLATTNAQALAMHMGQIVVVVEAESTTQKQLKESLRILGDSSNVSLLYNKARHFPNEAAYGSY